MNNDAANKIVAIVKTRHAEENTIYHCLYAYYFVGYSKTDLAKIFGKSIRTIANWIKRWEDDDEVGRAITQITRKFNQEKINYILNYYKKFPCSFLDEAKTAFLRIFHLSISLSTVCRILSNAGLTRKVIERRAINICIADIIRFFLILIHCHSVGVTIT